MLSIRKRSSDSLLKAAKKLIIENEGSSSSSSLGINNIPIPHQNIELRIVENQRSREIPEYVKLSPTEFMSMWITSTGAKRKASNMLLHYLRYKFDVDISTDYRTLLGTPTKKTIPMYLAAGSYVYLGVQQALNHLLSEAKGLDLSTTVLMQFFIDGVKFTRSTKDGAWVITMNIRNKLLKKRLTPKVVGVHYGEKKPADFNEFLWPLVMELLSLLEREIEFKDIVLKLKILNFVLDAKARTACKAIKDVNGYFGCDYCLAEGDHIDFRMAFLDLEAPLRNDVDYRARKYEDYHKIESVLELLPIDMIKSFPPDYLHCLLLGVVNWFLKYFRDTPTMLSSADYITIQQRIQMFGRTQPIEFQHKLRSFVDHLGTMKGTEFRQYILFVAPLLLKGIINEEKIGNLLKLHIASIIFTHKRFSHFYHEADTLMRMFIDEFAEIYDPCHVTYVFHSLCHMKIFVDIYGPWDNFSTFEYESYNNAIKNLSKGSVKPLVQITNRIVEIYQAKQYNLKTTTDQNIELRGRQEDGTFVQLSYYDLCFKTNCDGQNYMLLKSGEAVELVSISHDLKTGKVAITGKPLINRTSVFDVVDTTRFNIFKCKLQFGRPITFDVKDIDAKLWKIDIPESIQSAYYPIYVEDGKNCNNKIV